MCGVFAYTFVCLGVCMFLCALRVDDWFFDLFMWVLRVAVKHIVVEGHRPCPERAGLAPRPRSAPPPRVNMYAIVAARMYSMYYIIHYVLGRSVRTGWLAFWKRSIGKHANDGRFSISCSSNNSTIRSLYRTIPSARLIHSRLGITIQMHNRQIILHKIHHCYILILKTINYKTTWIRNLTSLGIIPKHARNKNCENSSNNLIGLLCAFYCFPSNSNQFNTKCTAYAMFFTTVFFYFFKFIFYLLTR